MSAPPLRPRKGRGAVSAPPCRFHATHNEAEDDGWGSLEQDLAPAPTTLHIDHARHIIARNDSPDIPFTQSINPYRGCEHGCVYCFARPTHAYLGLSPGLDFETQLYYKPDAVACLRRELAAPSYRVSPIALGINTDAYQPSERKLKLTRTLLEALAECRHPVSIVTKSALIERDADLLADMAKDDLVTVFFSITTLNHDLARRLEPRATAPARRLAAMEKLAAAGVPTGVMVAPLIPVLTDAEMEQILTRSQAAGAERAGYVILRLPHEVKQLFKEWLDVHAAGQAAHVMSVVRSLHGGREYDARFGQRMRGVGPFADLLAQRFHLACTRLGLNRTRRALNCDLFRPPTTPSDQLSLF